MGDQTNEINPITLILISLEYLCITHATDVDGGPYGGFLAGIISEQHLNSFLHYAGPESLIVFRVHAISISLERILCVHPCIHTRGRSSFSNFVVRRSVSYTPLECKLELVMISSTILLHLVQLMLLPMCRGMEIIHHVIPLPSCISRFAPSLADEP